MKYRKWITMICAAFMLCACTSKQPEKKKTNTISHAANGSLTVVSNFSLTKSLKTLIISMLLSFFIVKFLKINVLIWANVCYNRHRR